MFGGELGYSVNFTSLSRTTPELRSDQPVCREQLLILRPDHRRLRRSRRRRTACCAACPGDYSRLSAEAHWRKQIIDPIGQVWTPFVSVRGDVAALSVTNDTGVAEFHRTRQFSGHARHAHRRRGIPLSVHWRAVVGHPDFRADRPDHRSPQRDQHRQAAERGRAKPDFRRQQSVPASTNSPAGIASKAAAAPTSAASTPPSSTRAAPSTCCSGSPIRCSASTPTRWPTSPIPASTAVSIQPAPTMWRGSPINPIRSTM